LRLPEAQVDWDLDLYVAFYNDVILKCSIFVIDFVPSMGETADSISFLEPFGDFASDFFHDTGVVTANLNVGQLLKDSSVRCGFNEVQPGCFVRIRLTLAPLLVKKSTCFQSVGFKAIAFTLTKI